MNWWNGEREELYVCVYMAAELYRIGFFMGSGWR